MPPVTSSWLGWVFHKQGSVGSLFGAQGALWNVVKMYPVAESSGFQPAEGSSRNKKGPRVAVHREEGPDTEGVTCRAREGPSVGQRTPGLAAPAPGDLPWGTLLSLREAPPSPAVSQMEMLKERHCFR